jgi:hypothetical protein
MSKPMLGLLVVLASLGVAIAVAYGWQGLVVYLFFAGIPAVLALGAVVGTDFVSDLSRRRFGRGTRARS